MLYLHFLQLFHLVHEIGKKKSTSSYFFISNKREYLRVYLKSELGTEIRKKHLRVVN